jgi:thymidylate synthase
MFKEAAWVLSGDNRLAPLNEHIVRYHRFSDDGLFLAGAYGPQFVSQLPYVIRNLFSDPSSRQAVISLWKPSPQKSNDIPCTLTVQALIRDEKLYLVVNMRSSDTWLGIPYDVFTFSMMGTYILACLNRYGSNKFGFCKLGQLFLNVGSQHVYEENLKNVIALLDKRNKYDVFKHRHPDGGAPEYILEQLEIQAKEEFELRKTAGWDKEYTIIDKE